MRGPNRLLGLRFDLLDSVPLVAGVHCIALARLVRLRAQFRPSSNCGLLLPPLVRRQAAARPPQPCPTISLGIRKARRTRGVCPLERRPWWRWLLGVWSHSLLA